MTTNVNPVLLAQANAKLDRLHQSPNYRSFFTDAAIEAFSKVEGSAFAGTSVKREVKGNVSPRG